MKNAWIALAAVCALVLGVYVYTAHSGHFVSQSLNTADEYYNLLVQGFRAGQLNLKLNVPPGFAQLADPYDPAAHAPYPVLDMSYYKGKFYLYFGATPALLLFWPYVALTGHYLPQKDAAVIFCFVGFLVSLGLLCSLWRRYFSEVRVAVVAAGALALGLANGTPMLLARCDVHEVSISCEYMFAMLALGAIWCALEETKTEKRLGWLAAASVAYGLAVGARPSVLFGAVILLVPVAQAWCNRQNIWRPLLAATIPITLIGLGLMLYNDLRFDSPFEFGYHRLLNPDRLLTRSFFNLHYLWFNFRVYFLEPARWSMRFPFAHEIAMPPYPTGYVRAETPFGVLTNIPLVWLTLAVPLAWRNRSGPEASILGWFLLSAALLFGICACTITLFCGAAVRYEVDFLPALVLLAVVGMLGLERALVDRPNRRRVVRWGWGLLLGFSVGFNLLASVERVGEAHNYRGYIFSRAGQTQEAIEQYRQALHLKPDYAEAHNNLGVALEKSGKIQEALGHYEQAVRIGPSDAEAQNNLGAALEKVGRIQEAIGHYQEAVRLKPDYTEAHYNLGVALQNAGWVQEAIGHYEQALRLNPDYAEAHNNLGVALMAQGKLPEATGHFEQALHLKPDYAEGHNNLGIALARGDKLQDAVGQYEEALRLKPDYAEAHYDLGLALVRLGKSQEAISHWEQTVRIKPDYIEAHYNLGVALEKSGRTPEAIAEYKQVLQLRPDFTPAKNALTRLGAGH